MNRTVLRPVVFVASEPASRQKQFRIAPSELMTVSGSWSSSGDGLMGKIHPFFQSFPVTHSLQTWSLPLVLSSRVPPPVLTGRRNGLIRVLELRRASSVFQSCLWLGLLACQPPLGLHLQLASPSSTFQGGGHIGVTFDPRTVTVKSQQARTQSGTVQFCGAVLCEDYKSQQHPQ